MASLLDRFQNLINPPDDEYEDEDYGEEDYPEEQQEQRRGRTTRIDTRQSRVVSIDPKSQMHMVVCKPVSFGENVREIADELLARHTVVLNLERADKESARRIVDFLSGVAYANHGRLKPIAANIVIVTPFNVDLSGDDLMDELESSGVYF